MTTVSEMTKTRYSKVGVFRNLSPVARYFYDVYVGEEGFLCLYMWKRNDYRFPIYHHIKDMMKRRSRGAKKVSEVVEDDERHVYVKYDEIQGVVTDREHKEIQVLSVNEEMRILFRPYKEYDEFVETLKSKLGEKYFTKDNIEITDSVYI